MAVKTLKLTIKSKCNHLDRKPTCVYCIHLDLVTEKLIESFEAKNKAHSTNPNFKLIEAKEVVPEDWVEVQHEREYDNVSG